MKGLLPSFVGEQGLINPCLTRRADFEVYTDALKAWEDEQAPNKPLVSMVGSSTIMDLQGDVMEITALQDMTKIPDNLTIFLNHDYTVPDSVFGGLYGRPWLALAETICDLHLNAEAEQNNPKAMQTFQMVTRGKRRLGCSIGAQVTEYDYNPDEGILRILHVNTVEFSIVGIPAVQRAWVEVAAKSLFERALLEGRGDDALSLAPAVKGMYARAYETLVRHVESEALKKDLEHVRPRGTQTRRIMCMYNDGAMQFGLSSTITGKTQPISSDEVVSLLKSVPPVKAVCGKTSSPLAPIDHSWDGSEAEREIFAWARDEEGNITPAKARQCFLYCDPSSLDVQSGYRMPFCTISEASPLIIPKGVQVAADVLGSQGGVDASEEDQAGMRAKIATLYGRINSEYHPDPAWELPWNKKAIEPPVQKAAGDVSVGEDGTHEACSGTHSHAHTANGEQGEDGQHTHEHSHDGDASHGHSHAEKSLVSVHTTATLASSASLDTSAATLPLSADDRQVLLGIYRSISDSLGIKTTLGPTISPYSMKSLLAMKAIATGLSMMFDEIPPEALSEQEIREIVKEGREISEKNERNLEAIHAIVKGMHPGVCDPPATIPLEASLEVQTNPQLEASIEAITGLTQALRETSMKTLVEEAVQAQLAGLMQTIQATTKRIDALQHMPLGRPTAFVGRSLVEGEASRDDLIGGSAFSIVTRGSLQYRKWPDGYLAGERPPLSTEEKTYMSPIDIVRYNENREVLVPILD